MKRLHRTLTLLAAAALLAGCSTLAPEQDLADLQDLTQGRTAGVAVQLQRPGPEAEAAVAELLQPSPLSAEAAVRIALLHSPALQGALNTLEISDIARVQAGRAPNPHFSIARFTEGESRELERMLRFDVVGLLFLPWQSQWQGRQHELAKLQAAQEVVRLATEVRKTWIRAVAAQQSARYLEDVRDAAEAGAELAQRMARVGNFSRLQQAREQVLLADAAAELARARQLAVAEREQLVRLLGLSGAQAQFTLPERLPELPAQLAELQDAEARALRERLDVRSAVTESTHVSQSLGMVKTRGYLNGLTLGYLHSSTVDGEGAREVKRGWELELPLPLFDWGTARNARAEAIHRQALIRVRETATRARSETREAWHGWRTAWDLARHYRDEVVPLRRFINEEMVLRYNGMLSSVWELLAEARAQVLSVNNALAAQRDFWLADAELQLTLTGTSPGALTPLRGGGALTAGAPAPAH